MGGTDIKIRNPSISRVDSPTVSTDGKQILVDSSGLGNDGYRGSTSNSGIIDDGEVIRYRNFGTASNHFKIAKPSMGNTLEYDIYKLDGSTVTRTRDVTALSELIFGNTDADFIGSTLKVVCKDGVGGSIVATIDFASAAHGVTKFISSSGHTVTVVQTDGTDSADGTWRGDGLSFDGVDDRLSNLQSLPTTYTYFQVSSTRIEIIDSSGGKYRYASGTETADAGLSIWNLSTGGAHSALVATFGIISGKVLTSTERQQLYDAIEAMLAATGRSAIAALL